MIEQLFSSPTCFAAESVLGFDKLAFVFVSLFIAGLSLAMIKRTTITKHKIAFIYTHLLFLFFPLFLISINTSCGILCLNCHNNLPTLALYAVPTAAITTTGVSFFFVPTYFMHTHKRRRCTNRRLLLFIRQHAKQLDIPVPRLYVVDKAQPLAFSFRSFRSAIFVSVGMLDVFTAKEKHAVLLHELAHLKTRSSALKTSAYIARLFSPFSLVMKFYDQGAEEDRADRFAERIQGTRRHLLSARQKIDLFSR